MSTVAESLSAVRLGEPQAHRNPSVVPLVWGASRWPHSTTAIATSSAHGCPPGWAWGLFLTAAPAPMLHRKMAVLRALARGARVESAPEPRGGD